MPQIIDKCCNRCCGPCPNMDLPNLLHLSLSGCNCVSGLIVPMPCLSGSCDFDVFNPPIPGTGCFTYAGTATANNTSLNGSLIVNYPPPLTCKSWTLSAALSCLGPFVPGVGQFSEEWFAGQLSDPRVIPTSCSCKNGPMFTFTAVKFHFIAILNGNTYLAPYTSLCDGQSHVTGDTLNFNVSVSP